MGMTSRAAAWLLRKASEHYHAELRRVGPGQPIWTPHEYEKLAEEGYEKNPIVQSIIGGIVDRFASLSVFIARGLGRDMEVIDDHPALRLLRRPNPVMSEFEFREHWGKYLLIAGNSYTYAPLREAAAGGGRKAGEPLELWPWRPDLTKVIAGASFMNPIAGYRYDEGDLIGVDKISHARMFNPRNSFYGLPPLIAAAMEVDQHNAASAWNASVLQNRAVIDTWVNLKGRMGDVARAELKADLDAFTGPRRGSRRPLVTDSNDGVEVHRMALSAVELDYLGGKKLSATDICAAFRWPAQLVGIPGSLTYANFEQAEKTGYVQAVIPLLVRFCDAMSAFVLPKFEGGVSDLYFWFDLSEVSSLQEDRSKLYEQAERGFKAGFMDRKEAKEHVGLTASESEDAGVYWHDLQRQGNLGAEDVGKALWQGLHSAAPRGHAPIRRLRDMDLEDLVRAA